MTTKPFALTTKRIALLQKMLPKTKSKIDVPKLVGCINKAGGRYTKVAAHLGCKAHSEVWDRSLEDDQYAKRAMNEFDRLTAKQVLVWFDRVEKMDRALYQLSTDLAESWLEIARQPISKLPAARGKSPAEQRATVSSGHPFGLLLNALGIQLSVKSIAEMVEYGRRRAARSELRGIALK